MRQLDHPNIINLIDFSESKQYYYIILELAPGGELFHQIVRLTYFSEDLSRHVITQVANALEYLHEVRGVVHRYVQKKKVSHSLFFVGRQAGGCLEHAMPSCRDVSGDTQGGRGGPPNCRP